MNEIVLSSNTNDYIPTYSSDTVMVSMPPMAHKMSSPTSSTSAAYDEQTGAASYPLPDYALQMQMSYPVAYSIPPRFGYYERHPGSPESVASTVPPTTPPGTATAAVPSDPRTPFTTQVTSQTIDTPTPTPTSAAAMTPVTPTPGFANSTTARVKETIARANSVPMEFYQTEFLEYSKETYERKMDAKRNKRKRPSPLVTTTKEIQLPEQEPYDRKKRMKTIDLLVEASDSDDGAVIADDDQDDEQTGVDSAEIRRQIHIQSEQKRRAQIKDGFEELKKHLPGCSNKKMSKAALLTRTVQQIQHLKNVQNELLSEVERLVQENEHLKKFQHGMLQRQAMEKMYTF